MPSRYEEVDRAIARLNRVMATNGMPVMASAGGDEYAGVYGDDDLDRAIARLSPPPAGQWVTASAEPDVDPEFSHLFPPRPGEHRPAPVTAAGPVWSSSVPAYGEPSTSWANAVEELRSTHPDLVAAAENGDIEAPDLFPGSGDYPVATASGLPVEAIHQVLPWRARLVIAGEPNLNRAYQMVRDYAGPDPALEDEARINLHSHPAVADHMVDVRNWAYGGGISPDLRRQQAINASAGYGDDLDEYGFTQEEHLALFGPNG